jgi:hypothetical protein
MRWDKGAAPSILEHLFKAGVNSMSFRAIAGAALGACMLCAASTSAHAVSLNPLNTITDPNLNNMTADGPVYNLSASPYFWGAAFETPDSAGTAVFNFLNNTSDASVLTLAIGTVLQGFGGYFTGGVTASWLGGQSVTIPEGDHIDGTGKFNISTLLGMGQIGTLIIQFGDPVGLGASAPGIQLQVGNSRSGGFPPPAVPLPPALLLLLTGLSGLGLLARKKA